MGKKRTANQLAKIACECHDTILMYLGSAIAEATRLGRALSRAKDQVADDAWEEWLAANFEGSADLARAYMRLDAKHVGRATLFPGEHTIETMLYFLRVKRRHRGPAPDFVYATRFKLYRAFAKMLYEWFGNKDGSIELRDAIYFKFEELLEARLEQLCIEIAPLVPVFGAAATRRYEAAKNDFCDDPWQEFDREILAEFEHRTDLTSLQRDVISRCIGRHSSEH